MTFNKLNETLVRGGEGVEELKTLADEMLRALQKQGLKQWQVERLTAYLYLQAQRSKGKKLGREPFVVDETGAESAWNMSLAFFTYDEDMVVHLRYADREPETEGKGCLTQKNETLVRWLNHWEGYRYHSLFR